ncbi:hypothetical protein P9112_014291 [Eukaryota sp. TZLM1-RC]
MLKNYQIESFLEPLLSNLADESDRNFFGDSRGDVLVPGLDGSMIISDVRSTDVSNSSNEKLAQSYNSPFRRAEEARIIKYTEKINNLNSNSHTQYIICPFAVTLSPSLGKTALFWTISHLLSKLELEEYLTKPFGKTEQHLGLIQRHSCSLFQKCNNKKGVDVI